MEDTKKRNAENARNCLLHQASARFLRSVLPDDLAISCLEPTEDHCYCDSCEKGLPDVISDIGGSTYELPKGWCGFGLKLRPAAKALDCFNKWPVTYHGCKAANVPSILLEGSLLLPGDKLMDGTKLQNAHTGGGESRLQIYTSPSILYSELDIYTEPIEFEGHNVRVVLQCRQNPASLETCGETIGWKKRFGDVAISAHVTNHTIECYTASRAAVIPYRMLIKFNSDTREYQEYRNRVYQDLKPGSSCRVVSDAAIRSSDGISALPEVLGRIGDVLQVQGRQVELSFKILRLGDKGKKGAGAREVDTIKATLHQGLVACVAHCPAICTGQRMRVVAEKERAEAACQSCKYVVGMDAYLGMSGRVTSVGKGRVRLEFDDNVQYWWGLEALESLACPSGAALRSILSKEIKEEVEAVWEFRESGKWKRFDKDAAAAVEAAVIRREAAAESTFVNSRGQETCYRYDLVRMKQTNTRTSFCRHIRRTPPPPPPAWQFDLNGSWQAFDADAARKAEEALQSSSPGTRFTSEFTNPNTLKRTTYSFDLKMGTQKNTDTGFVRKIRRIPPYDASEFDNSTETVARGKGKDEGARVACSICCEDGRISASDAAEGVTEKCQHVRSCCDGCLAKHVEAEVRNKGNFSTITCPETGCAAKMEHHKVQRWAIASVFETYDQLLLRDTLSKNEEFRWCALTACGSGQLHPDKDKVPIMKCHKCKRKTCFTHRSPWHDGRTCQQYDSDAVASEEVALLQALANGGVLKQCPKCGQGIEKEAGCDHMTCRPPAGCGHEFCWRCFAPYDGDKGIRKIGNTAHQPSCLFYM